MPSSPGFIVYCGHCGADRNLPKESLRTSTLPCDYCGGYDEQQVRVTLGRPPNRRVEQRNKRLNNFSYPAALIDGMPGNINQAAEKEYESS
jgi:hypothetical protein